MRRLLWVALLVLAACSPKPRYVRYPVETVDSLRAQLAISGPATIRQFDSLDTQWLHVEPTDGRALAPMRFTPLNKSWECPPICP